MVSPSRKVPAKRQVHTNNERTEVLASQKEAVFTELIKIIEVLRTQTNKVKVEGIKDSVERAANTMMVYRKTRDALQADFRV